MAETAQEKAAAFLAALPPATPIRRASDLAPNDTTLPTGLPPLDRFLGGGLPLNHTTLLAGHDGQGVILLLQGLLATVTRTQPVLFLDPFDRFDAEGAVSIGVRLTHLPRVRVRDPRTLRRVLATAVRDRPYHLIAWDAGILPPDDLLDRLLPDLRVSGCALIIAVRGVPHAAPGITGATLVARHVRWEQGDVRRPEFRGQTIAVTVTDHRRRLSAAMPLTFHFPTPLPPLLRVVGEGVIGDAAPPGRGDPPAGDRAANRRAG